MAIPVGPEKVVMATDCAPRPADQRERISPHSSRTDFELFGVMQQLWEDVGQHDSFKSPASTSADSYGETSPPGLRVHGPRQIGRSEFDWKRASCWGQSRKNADTQTPLK
jgi:hypothetical protein